MLTEVIRMASDVRWLSREVCANLELSFGHMVISLKAKQATCVRSLIYRFSPSLPAGNLFATLACFAPVRKHATVTAMYSGCTVRCHEWGNLMLH